MKVIVYQHDGGVAWVYPTPEALEQHGLQAIALKDVPAGKPFALVEADSLPRDYPQSTWAVDAADLTDGVGADSNEFLQEQA
jgi:hypothetical protein